MAGIEKYYIPTSVTPSQEGTVVRSEVLGSQSPIIPEVPVMESVVLPISVEKWNELNDIARLFKIPVSYTTEDGLTITVYGGGETGVPESDLCFKASEPRIENNAAATTSSGSSKCDIDEVRRKLAELMAENNMPPGKIVSTLSNGNGHK